jgi:hypothetical protein
MDKVLGIIIGAAILTVASLSLMTISSGSITDFGNTANSQKTS